MRKIRFTRGYGGFTDKAAALSGANGMWMPKKFCTNWTDSKPPKEVEAEIPNWLFEKWKDLHNVTVLN